MIGRIESPDVIILSTQRSGTHLLQSMLGAHSRVQTRGEFILQFRRKRAAGIDAPELEPAELTGYRFRRRPGFVNLGIVMYGQIKEYEALCQPLLSTKIIHLIRDPQHVARSQLQMKRDRDVLGDKYRAHYHVRDAAMLPPVVAHPEEHELAEKIRASQAYHLDLLEGKPDVFTISYEEICQDRQVRQFDEKLAARLFAFLDLDVEAVSTELVKTSARGSGVNGLSVMDSLAI